MNNRLAGKVALITGAASGIGAATAECFWHAGANVLIVDRNGAGAATVAQNLDPTGQRVRQLQADVQDEAAAQACVQTALKAWGRLDVLVNNAAVASGMDLLEFTPAEFDRVLGINLKGPLLFCKYAVPAMRSSGGGAIVNVASISASCGIPHQALYAPSKGGLLQMTRQMAIEYAADKIRVNAVSPGTIETPLLLPPNDDVENHQRRLDWFRAQHPMGRFGQPAEVAVAILFLASDEASFITGANLAVDGGYAAQ